jgi:transcription initiation factor TFIIH subunit 3
MLFQSFLDTVLVFCNAFLACKHGNRVAIIASQTKRCDFLFPRRTHQDDMDIDSVASRPANVYHRFWQVDQAVVESLKYMAASGNVDVEAKRQESASQITGAIGLALTYMNKIIKQNETTILRPRILVLSASTDEASQYISIMNSIFAAQKSVRVANYFR